MLLRLPPFPAPAEAPGAAALVDGGPPHVALKLDATVEAVVAMVLDRVGEGAGTKDIRARTAGGIASFRDASNRARLSFHIRSS